MDWSINNLWKPVKSNRTLMTGKGQLYGEKTYNETFAFKWMTSSNFLDTLNYGKDYGWTDGQTNMEFEIVV